MSVDNVYLNLVINNNSSSASSAAEYNVTYDQPILDRGSDFQMAVVKFEIPLSELPLFIFPIVPNQANSNLSTMKFGVCENDDPDPSTVLFSESVIWESQVFNAMAPTQNLVDKQVVTPYYGCFSYQHFVYLCNKALLQAWIAAGSPGGAGNQPYFEFDVSEKLIHLVAPYDFINAVNPSVNGQGWKVYMNSSASYYFQAFDYKIDLPTDVFQIDTHSLATNYSYVAPLPYPQGTGAHTAGSTYLIKQEYPSNEYINSVRKIVLVSNSLPVRKEYFPRPDVSQNGSINQLGVIASFNIDLENKAGSQRSIALYEANPYRMIDILTDGALRSLDIKVFWGDAKNNLYPLKLSPEDIVQIELGFFRKE